MMKLKEYVVVADSSLARVFRTGSSDDGVILMPVQTFENPEGRKQNRELDSDRQGMKATMASGYHGLSGEENSHQHDVANFARDVCNFLQEEHAAGNFRRLNLAAGPQLLGVLRKQLSDNCAKALGETINKNLIHATEQEILAQFS